MLRFMIRRALSLIPTIFLIITFSFIIIRVAPGGPFSTSGISSRVKRSTALRSWPRTPIRNCTSGGSGLGGAAGPWQALIPKNSV